MVASVTNDGRRDSVENLSNSPLLPGTLPAGQKASLLSKLKDRLDNPNQKLLHVAGIVALWTFPIFASVSLMSFGWGTAFLASGVVAPLGGALYGVAAVSGAIALASAAVLIYWISKRETPIS